ncbi:type IX secretion system membrane protein PorP/SprF [Flavobacterium sp. ANB]|uniref:PorP/SprF family type IX secretion system membrane protein n=1 Tax=unclassified Flavobacterium TaxID=196869 RepID=UPI0012B77742|nr:MULTISPECIES: type IX secretion system membrane protein PorP/SprF [unclassified Flavobacterium]MBF4516763.1 type IX secretion system membrane protein PorP/SprF [Flavobacterium sp. ANB]MTD69341.1 type IX secretion system membrane protein PorP/SprF [Flavobacterium sp. LC2016-13]
MKNKLLFLMLFLFCTFSISAQQESQYSQYMYNTMTFNPGYTGSRQVATTMGLYRTQWVGLDGAPTTMNFSIQTPIGSGANGIGLDIVNDEIGPASNIGLMANFAYTILGGTDIKYSFGICGGFDNFSVDYSMLNPENPDPNFVGEMSQFSPNVGVGFYIHSPDWYIGLSSPKLLKTNFYDDVKETVYSAKSQFYIIAGYVLNLNPNLKFKPATLVKAVFGAPISVDVSASFLINDKFTVGAAYRWDAAVSALAGFQVTDIIQIGYGYDHDTTGIGNYNSGSHELFLRFDLIRKSKARLVTPRFF